MLKAMLVSSKQKKRISFVFANQLLKQGLVKIVKYVPLTVAFKPGFNPDSDEVGRIPPRTPVLPINQNLEMT